MGHPKEILYSEQDKDSILGILERRRNKGSFGKHKKEQLKEVHFSFCLTPRLYKRMCEIAKKEQKTVSEIVRYCLEFYFDLKKLDERDS